MVVVRFINQNGDTKVNHYENIEEFIEDESIDSYKLIDLAFNGIYVHSKDWEIVKDTKED